MLLVVILVGSALTGTLIWEWINPVSLMGRSTVMGFGSGALLILALFYLIYWSLNTAGAGTFVRLARCMACWVTKV